jgi:hypothetical protein
MRTVRHLGWKLRGPLIGLTAGLIALALGAGYFLGAAILLFVGLIAWALGLRGDIADLREEGYGKHSLGGWLSGGDTGGGGG